MRDVSPRVAKRLRVELRRGDSRQGPEKQEPGNLHRQAVPAHAPPAAPKSPGSSTYSDHSGLDPDKKQAKPKYGAYDH